MTSGSKITIPLPRLPGFVVAILVTLLVVGGFMAVDRTQLHWYAADVPDLPADLSGVVDDVTRLRDTSASQDDDLNALRADLAAIDQDRLGLRAFEAVQRLSLMWAVQNWTLIRQAGLDVNPQHAASDCFSYIMYGSGSDADCGFLPP